MMDDINNIFAKVGDKALQEALASGYRTLFESESYGIREATKDEYDRCYLAVVENEVNLEYPEPCPERDEFRQECLDDAEHTWDIHLHAYTVDGTQLLVTVQNQDGSSYVYLVYVDENDRGKGYGTALLKKAIEDSPNGLSLHTNKHNVKAQALYKRLGFEEYPSVDDREIFMANRPGIGGNEWWEK